MIVSATEFDKAQEELGGTGHRVATSHQVGEKGIMKMGTHTMITHLHTTLTEFESAYGRKPLQAGRVRSVRVCR